METRACMLLVLLCGVMGTVSFNVRHGLKDIPNDEQDFKAKWHKKCHTIEDLENGHFIDHQPYRRYKCDRQYRMNIPQTKAKFVCKMDSADGYYKWTAKKYPSLNLTDVRCQRNMAKCPDPPTSAYLRREDKVRYQLRRLNRRGDVVLQGRGYYTGDQVEYSCAPGYGIENTIIITYDYEDYDFDNSSDVTAPESLEVIPESFNVTDRIICDVTGRWIGAEFDDIHLPECTAIRCDANRFENITSGQIVNFTRSYSYLGEMKVECDEGYMPIDRVKTVVCTDFDSFGEGALPNFGCEETRCPMPARPANGRMWIEDRRKYNTTVTFYCDDTSRYTLIGQPVWTCGEDGQWGGETCVTCQPKGSDVWTDGFGTADFSSGRMVNETTLFNIGSVTKSFTMTLLGILLTEKGLDWTTKVADILPRGYKFVDDYRTRHLTLKDLLCHRTGLARLDVGWAAGIPASLSRADFCKRIVYLPESKPVRDTLIYNNYMYMMLGRVAETLGGDSWENLMTSKVLRPIGMTSTRFLMSPADVLKDDVAHPYFYVEDQDNFQPGTTALYSLHPIDPAGAIMADAVDMAKYMRFHMDKGKTDSGVQLLDKELLLDAYVPKITMNKLTFTKPQFPVSVVNVGYGYGWVDSTYRGYKRTWHNGGLFSYNSLVLLYPDEDIAIYGNTNGPNGNLASNALTTIFLHISDHLLGETPWLNTTTTCTFPEPWETLPTSNVTTAQYENTTIGSLNQYTGSFGNHLLPDIKVDLVGSHLVAAMGTKNVTGILHQTSETDTFKYQITYPPEFAAKDVSQFVNVKFNRPVGALGSVISCTVTYEVDVTYTKGVSILQTPGVGTPGFVG